MSMPVPTGRCSDARQREAMLFEEIQKWQLTLNLERAWNFNTRDTKK
jgi:hypothetical protein